MNPLLTKFLKKTPGAQLTPAEDSDLAPSNEQSHAQPALPHLLLFGSLTDCSKKDAIAYCEGLLERNVTAKTTSGYRVMAHPLPTDSDTQRWAFEIHEGGSGVSLLEAVMGLTAKGETLRLPLQQGRVTEVFEHAGELISLIYPAEAEVQLSDSATLDSLASTKSVRPALGTGRTLAMAAAGLTIFALLTFVGSNVAYYRANVDLSYDHVLLAATVSPRENPINQMTAAIRQADAKQTHVTKLEFIDGKWAWTLATDKPTPSAAANPAPPAPATPASATPETPAQSTSPRI